MSIATTILQQLGGNEFRMMTGANSFLDLGNCLTFRIPKGMFNQHNLTVVTITLNGWDWYDLKFFKRVDSKKPAFERNDVDCFRLMDVFEEITGLLVTLNGRG